MITLLAVALLAAAPAGEPVADDRDRNALREFVAAVIQRDGNRDGVAVPTGPGESVRRWMQTNGKALDGARHTAALREQPWGLFAWGPKNPDSFATLHLYVFDWHRSGTLVVYGLTGGVKRAYVFGDPAKVELPFARVGCSTVYTVPKEAPDPLGTVVVLELDDKPQTTQLIARPGDDGQIVMHARDAVVHGRTLRYEPEPHKDTVGYWSDPSDWVRWEFEITEPGRYSVDILQGCGKGSGGSTVNFSVGEQVMKVTVQDTGGFQNFVSRRIGALTFDKPGRHTLTVKPVDKPGVAVMDLRSVTLTRDKEGAAR